MSKFLEEGRKKENHLNKCAVENIRIFLQHRKPEQVFWTPGSCGGKEMEKTFFDCVPRRTGRVLSFDPEVVQRGEHGGSERVSQFMPGINMGPD